jgi:CRP-like cAMP-binding protein
MDSSIQTALPEHQDLLGSGITSRNELLREIFGVPSIARELLPELKLVQLSVNQVLYEQGDRIESVYFPLESVVSGLAITEDGTTLETFMIGREGLAGIESIMGRGPSRQWSWVTVGGSAIQIETKFMEKALLQSDVVLKALLKTYRSLITQLSQRCVCNTRHTIMERLCCWLLMIHDRVGSSNLSFTQEMIASRVGARRAGITVAAGMLQSMHAIGYRRGQLHIQDRPMLERTVCECYNLMRGDYKSPPSPSSVLSL